MSLSLSLSPRLRKLMARRWVRPALATALAGLAVGYLAYALNGQWVALRAFALEVSAWDMGVLVAGIAGTLALSCTYHVLILASVEGHSIPASRVANAYLGSQVVRYVPGRVAGVVFQMSMLGPGVRVSSVVASLLVQTLHDYAWTMVFCAFLLAMLVARDPWLIALAPIPVALLHAVHRGRVTQRLLRRVPWAGARLPEPPPGPLPYATQTAVQACVWVPMLMGMLLAFGGIMDVRSSAIAGTLYLLAAVASLAVIVVPSGLFVREALFVWAGGLAALPADTLAFVAVATRVAMTLSELLVAALFAAITFRNRWRKT